MLYYCHIVHTLGPYIISDDVITLIHGCYWWLSTEPSTHLVSMESAQNILKYPNATEMFIL